MSRFLFFLLSESTPLGGNIALASLCLLIFLSERSDKTAAQLNPDCSSDRSVDQNIIPTAKPKINTDSVPVHGEICKSDAFQGNTFDIDVVVHNFFAEYIFSHMCAV